MTITSEVNLVPSIDLMPQSPGVEWGSRDLALDFRGESLHGADLQNRDLSRADLRDVDLSAANLTGAVLFETDLRGADLTGAILEGADLRNANLRLARLGGANLRDAVCGGANFDSASLVQADLSFADLRGCSLEQANLRRARLEHTEMGQTNLREADLQEATATACSFHTADLRGAVLRRLSDYGSATFLHADIRNADFCGGLLLRRQILDENYLDEFRTKSRLNQAIFFLWSLTSDCGRSATRWAMFIGMIVMAFGAAYAHVDIDFGPHQTWLSPLYFSVVTLTTLGFGDVLPKSALAQMIVIAQVVIGYIGLGGLLSVLSTKMGRRAE